MKRVLAFIFVLFFLLGFIGHNSFIALGENSGHCLVDGSFTEDHKNPICDTTTSEILTTPTKKLDKKILQTIDIPKLQLAIEFDSSKLVTNLSVDIPKPPYHYRDIKNYNFSKLIKIVRINI